MTTFLVYLNLFRKTSWKEDGADLENEKEKEEKLNKLKKKLAEELT